MEDNKELTPEPDTTTPDEITNEPRGNAAADGADVEKGEDKLDGTLPY